MINKFFIILALFTTHGQGCQQSQYTMDAVITITIILNQKHDLHVRRPFCMDIVIITCMQTSN